MGSEWKRGLGIEVGEVTGGEVRRAMEDTRREKVVEVR